MKYYYWRRQYNWLAILIFCAVFTYGCWLIYNIIETYKETHLLKQQVSEYSNDQVAHYKELQKELLALQMKEQYHNTDSEVFIDIYGKIQDLENNLRLT